MPNETVTACYTIGINFLPLENATGLGTEAVKAEMLGLFVKVTVCGMCERPPVLNPFLLDAGRPRDEDDYLVVLKCPDGEV